MTLLRAFLASEIPALLQDEIQAATAALRERLGDEWIRWVPPRNIHLTLKFLGDISPVNLGLLKQMLIAEAAQHAAFEIEIAGLGSYPTPRRPRVLWIGVHAPPALLSLQRAVELTAARLGYGSPEERAFSPHLTIGRVRQNIAAADLQRVRLALEETRIGVLGRARIEAVHLFKSELDAGGSVYTRLFSAPLGKQQS